MTPDDCQLNPHCPFSANRFQYELLKNLHEIGHFEFSAICPRPLASFPKTKVLFSFPKRKSDIETQIEIFSPFFINFGILKQASLIFSVSFALIRLFVKQKPTSLVLYNAYLGYSLPSLVFGKLFKVQIIGIIADLPPRYSWSSPGFVRQIEAKLQRSITMHFDKLLPFSHYIIDDLGYRKPYMLMSPPITFKDFGGTTFNNTGFRKRSLFFAGNLCEINGLKLLLEGFKLLDDKTIELWISGRGDMQKDVEIAAEEDSRIHFFGFLNRKELLHLLNKSLVLINPRPSTLIEHRLNFPSKIIEYMAVGRPVISTVCSDIIDEYGKYIFLIEDETPEGFAKMIKKVFYIPTSELDSIGLRGREFILKNKTWGVIAPEVDRFITSGI